MENVVSKLTNTEVMALSNLDKEGQRLCASIADVRGWTAEETAKRYYLAALLGRDPALVFSDLAEEDIELEKMERLREIL
jgi:hypothetical protein